MDCCVDKSLKCCFGTLLPSPIAESCSHRKGMIARRVFAFDFKVTTIACRNHLSINGVWAQGINYFREKSFNFFVNV